MFECAGIIRASTLVPFDTVPFWNVPSLLPNCRRSVRRRGTEGPSNSFAVGLESLPIQVTARCCQQEIIGFLIGSFFCTMIFLQIVCYCFAVFNLVKEQSLQNTDFRHLWNSSHHLIPITDETTQVVALEFDTEQILQ